MKYQEMKPKSNRMGESKRLDCQQESSCPMRNWIDRVILKPLASPIMKPMTSCDSKPGNCVGAKQKIPVNKQAPDPIIMIGTHLPNTTSLDTAMIKMLMTPPTIKPSLDGVKQRRRQMGLPEHSTAPPMNPNRKYVAPPEKRAGGYEINTSGPFMPKPNSSLAKPMKASGKNRAPSPKPSATEKQTRRDIFVGKEEPSRAPTQRREQQFGLAEEPARNDAGIYEAAASRVTPQLIKDRVFIEEIMDSVSYYVQHARQLEEEARDDLRALELKCSEAEKERQMANQLTRECIELDKTVTAVEEQRKDQLRALKAGMHDAIREIPVIEATTTLEGGIELIGPLTPVVPDDVVEVTVNPITIIDPSIPEVPDDVMEVIILPDIEDRSELPLGKPAKSGSTEEGDDMKDVRLAEKLSASKSSHSMELNLDQKRKSKKQKKATKQH